jgi:hypothetical protein
MSQFLGVNTAVLGKLSQILENTDIEVRNALAYGRNSVYLKNSVCYTMLYTLKNNKKVNELFVSILGRTATELFLNFINSGFVLPQRLNELVNKAYYEVVQELFWSGGSLVLFDTDFSKIQHSYAPVSFIKPTGESVRLQANAITKDLDIATVCQLKLRQLINCLSINSYTSGLRFMSTDEQMKQFFGVLQTVNELYTQNVDALEVKYKYTSRAKYIQRYFCGEVSNDPAEVLLTCYVNDDASLLCTMFNIDDTIQILGIFARYVFPMVELMKNVKGA